LFNDASPEDFGGRRVRQVGIENGMPAAGETFQALLGGSSFIAVVNGDGEAALRQLHRDDTPDSPGGARYQGNGFGFRAQRLAPWLF
jgi:hypothetical protein